MKFKVGDRVRVKEWEDILKDSRAFNTFTDEMREYCGKIFKVESTHAGFIKESYALKGIDRWYFESEMLEPATLKLKDILTEENKGKTFKRKSDGLIVKITNEGDIVFGSDYLRLSINSQWEEVKKPVDFMTAFRAWVDEGKTIRCNTEGLDEVFRYDKECPLASFGARQIKYGKWYVED